MDDTHRAPEWHAEFAMLRRIRKQGSDISGATEKLPKEKMNSRTAKAIHLDPSDERLMIPSAIAAGYASL